MTDSRMLAGGLRVAGCGAIQRGITHAGHGAGSQMGSAARGKSALSAGAAGRSSWARIEGGNGGELRRTRFVICYYSRLSLGENALGAGFRWFLGLTQAYPAAVRPGGAVQIQEGGRGSRPLRARSLSIHPAKKKIFTLPDYPYE